MRHDRTTRRRGFSQHHPAVSGAIKSTSNYMELGVLMMPQAILAPEFPDGSLTISSAFSWMTIEVPSPVKTESIAVGSSDMPLVLNSVLSVPSGATVKLKGKSPA